MTRKNLESVARMISTLLFDLEVRSISNKSLLGFDNHFSGSFNMT